MLAVTMVVVCIATLGLLALTTRAERRVTAWAWAYFGVVAWCAISVAMRWDARSDWTLAAAHAGWALIALAAMRVVHVILNVRTAEQRWSQVATSIAAGLILPVVVAACGHGLRVLPRVLAEGWWAGVPTTVLIECTPWLPQRLIRETPRWTGLEWNLEHRSSDMWRWQRARLASHLRARYRAAPSESTFDDLCMADSIGAETDPATAIWFKELVDAFLDGSPEAREDASDRFYNYLPTNWKISHPEVGAIHGRLVLAGRMDRMIDLVRDLDYRTSGTAVDLIATCGDDALPAVQPLIDLARRDWSRRSSVCEAINYLARTSPDVRGGLIEVAESGGAFDRILAIEALDQSNWASPDVQVCLDAIAADGEPVLSAFAKRHRGMAAPDREPDLVGIVMSATASSHPDRAAFMASLVSESEHLNLHVPRLIDLLADQDPEVREAACLLIRHVWWHDCPGRAESTRVALEPLLSDPDPTVAESARETIDDIDWWLSRPQRR